MYQIKPIQSPQDPFYNLIEQDPVRPHIPAHKRLGKNAQVWVLTDCATQTPQAVLCVNLLDRVAHAESDLFTYDGDAPDVITFYSIWSLKPQGGRRMIHQLPEYVKQNWPTVTRMVTLSPPTQMAETFHVSCGAKLLHTNDTTVNYEYEFT
jgi:hypothetical protein